MSFNQIVLKNFKQNIRHYAMYIFSLIVSIVLYFSFVTLKYTNSINNDNSMKIIQEGSKVGANFLFIIIVIFLMYANHLFVKRRTREFALYQLIGLTRNNIMRMLLIEQTAMFLVTGILGMIIGVFGSKILLMIVLKVLSVRTSVALTFQPLAVTQTIILLCLSFILILIQCFWFLRRRSILTMMNDNTKTEVNQAKVTLLELISGIVGIAMVILGYYLSTEMFGKYSNAIMFLVFAILFLTTVGAYLFFRSSVSLIFKSLKRLKQGKISITDVVFTSSIMHKMKKNALSLTIIATLSAVTVTVLCFGAISKSSIDDNIYESSPQDFNLNSEKQSQQFEQKLEQAHIPFKPIYKEVADLKIANDDFFVKQGNSLMSNPTAMFITSNEFFKDKDVHGNKAKLINVSTIGGGMVKYNLNKTIQFKGQSSESFKVIGDQRTVDFRADATYGQPVLLVSAEQYEKLSAHSKEINKQYGYNLLNKKDWPVANKILKQVNPNIESQKIIRQDLDNSIGILLFVTSFLGLAFLIAAGCIIYIKQMDETEDEMSNYRILRKIGYTHRDMLKGLTLKVIFNFALPLVISLLHAYFAAKAYMKIMNSTNMLPVYVVMIVYSIIFMIFAIMSILHSSRIVKHSI
ncbi:ABC transporter permease [Staphylococcus sp. ACRSN]|uniref:FtsX-like permease family protein n=1 Tax=Staphylococcus sp. ACRSN TaxID=2918214 RepID=UPI001EF30203|nr:ABC transporter permease [Staphylococcus sp. ACRSN]MCG7339040.1 ABC transporter permease [Staphylococcus sp. ACRSN]